MTNNSINDPSVELVLVQLARKSAPRLISGSWEKPGDLKKPLHILARQLANYHILVVLADRMGLDAPSIPGAVQECAELYAHLYRVLISASFPSLTRINSFFYHGRSTLIIAIEADSRLAMEAMAGFISPYVAERQGTRTIADIEVISLMEKALEKMDLPQLEAETYDQLCKDGAATIKHMLSMRMRQLPLTWFDEPFFSQIGSPAMRPEEVNSRKIISPTLPPLDKLPGEIVNPFSEGAAPAISDDGEPDFIRNMNQLPAQQRPVNTPPERREPPVETNDAPPETGPQAPVQEKNERVIQIPPPAWRGDTLPNPPLPPFKRGNKGKS